MREAKKGQTKLLNIVQAMNILLTIAFIIFILSFSAYAEAPNEKDLSACLPEKLANLKAINKPNTTIGKAGEMSVARKYKKEGEQVEVSLWQLPKGKEDLPFFKGKEKLSLIVVAGRLCFFETDIDSKTTTIVVKFDKGNLDPPPFTYSVGIVANRVDGKELVTRVAEALDHDKIFRLYDQR
ncbi:MAG: hypothetical protein KKD47_05510 [Proteobacteria bacterium]|nr:hypothetical protein [Pseudomonadota bacterium]